MNKTINESMQELIFQRQLTFHCHNLHAVAVWPFFSTEEAVKHN